MVSDIVLKNNYVAAISSLVFVALLPYLRRRNGDGVSADTVIC